MRYGGGLTALATLTIIDTTEPLVDDPDGAAPRSAAHGRQAVTSNDTTTNGAVSRNGVASVPMTVASPATSNGRLWRQIERSPWDAPDGEPADARSQLRFTVRSGTDGYPLDDVDNYPLHRRRRRRRRRVVAALVVVLALIGAAVAWIVASAASESAPSTSTVAPGGAAAESSPGNGRDDLDDTVVVPTPTAPAVARDGEASPTADDVADDTITAETAPDGASTSAPTNVDGAPGDADGSISRGPDTTGPDADGSDTTGPDAGGDGGAAADPGSDGAATTPAAPAVGFARIDDADGRILNACTSFPFDPVSVDYQLFSFLVRTDSDRWIVDRWFDTDIDGIFVHRLGSGLVSTGSATDGPEIIDGSADGIDIVINPPATAFEECEYIVRTSPTDLDNEPYTQAILDSCVVTDGAVNRLVAALTEGGHLDVTDRSDGTGGDPLRRRRSRLGDGRTRWAARHRRHHRHVARNGRQRQRRPADRSDRRHRRAPGVFTRPAVASHAWPPMPMSRWR